MSEKQAVSKWNNPSFLHSLMVALYGELKGNLTKEVKDAIEQKMHRDGFEDVTWDAIRSIGAQKLFVIITTNKMSRAPMKWTSEADQQILVAMVKTMTPNAEQYSAIIQELHTYGYSCTVSALKCAFLYSPFSSLRFCLPNAPYLPLSHETDSIAPTSLFSFFQLPPPRTSSITLRNILLFIITSTHTPIHRQHSYKHHSRWPQPLFGMTRPDPTCWSPC
ncbi:hypothetical protein LZ30DRAFT_581607 [Colletotrichum cereale]|nr:hypothetical protein LZ30DRAFT_581607 [Colletotrichum cereale]